MVTALDEHTIDSLLAAAVHGRDAELEGWLAGNQQHAQRAVVAALLAARQAMQRGSPLPAERLAIENALALPGSPPDLVAQSVGSLRMLLAPDDAQVATLMRWITGLVPAVSRPRARAALARASIRDRQQRMAYAEAAREAEAALTGFGRIADDPDLALEFRVHAALTLAQADQFTRAEAMIESLQSEAEILDARIGVNLAHLRAAVLIESGQPERACRALAGDLDPRLRGIRAMALMRCGRLAEAEDELPALAHRPDCPLDVRKVGRLGVAMHLAARRIDAARDALAALADLGKDFYDPYFDSENLHLEIALNQRDHAIARAILLRADPSCENARLHPYWARVHLLEGDREAALDRFRAMRTARSMAALAEGLRWAWEMSPADIVMLCRDCETPAPPARRFITPVPAAPEGEALIGESEGMRRARAQITQFAPLPQTVLIVGETGTGKEIAARRLHAGGRSPTSPFLPLNCAAIADGLAEAELFGWTRGAFTGADRAGEGMIAAARDGTVFLDEIASMSLRLQGLLLRVLETGDFRPVGGQEARLAKCRFVVAANEDLERAVEEGRFRRDLLYRLERLIVRLPPLRERPEDIPRLAAHFLRRLTGGDAVSVAPRLLAAWQRRPWPGNVRELRNAVERLALLQPGRRELDDHGEGVPAQPMRPASTVAAPAAAQTTSRAPGPARRLIPGVPAARARRGRILELIAERGQLQRQEVVAALGCAPGTATEDLAALVDCGYIRRIDTSGSLRTSYFVPAGQSAPDQA